MSIILTRPIRIAGTENAAGATVSLTTELEAQLVQQGSARYVSFDPSIARAGLPTVDISKLRTWRNARGRAAGRTYSPKALFLGHSMERGIGSNGALAADIAKLSFSAQLARLLTAQGLPCSWGNVVGDGLSTFTSSVAYPVYDPRVVLGAGWSAVAATLNCAGGLPWTNNSNTNALAFTPTDPFDTIVVQYHTNTGLGTFTVDVDGGAALATINSSAAAGTVQSAEISCALGNHTLNIKRNGTGADVFITGFSTYQKNANVCEVQMLNAGMSGANSGTNYQLGLIATHPTWGRDLSYLRWAPDLTIILIGYNDLHGGISLASFIANLNTLVKNRLTTGDKIFVIEPAALNATQSIESQRPYRRAVQQVAQANDILTVDLPSIWGEYDGAPDFYFDDIHPSGAGYGDIASLVARVLMA